MRYSLLWLLLFAQTTLAQQLADRSPFSELGFVWNPAMTALYDYWEVSASYRQQWLGFENAPSTALLTAQYPFQDENMSLGGVFTHDRIQPLKYTSLAATYAYKFQLGIRPRDQGTIGVLVNASQYFVDALNIIVNDPDDNLLPVGENSALDFNAGVGFFYTTFAGARRKRFDQENAFFFGGALHQMLPAKLVIPESNRFANWRRALHGNFLIGFRMVKSNLYIEPSAWVNYSQPNISDLNLNIKVEKPEAFWTALTYSTTQTLGLQVGMISPSSFAKGSFWRIGVLSTYNIGTFGNYRGVGLEALIAYRYAL